MRVFISHSMNEEDQIIVKESCSSLGSISVDVILSEKIFRTGRISDKIRGDIRDADCVLVILTKEGRESAWVEQEIGIALEQEKLIIPLLETGLTPPGALSEVECIYFNRGSYLLSFQNALRYIAELQKKNLMKLFLVVAIIGLAAFIVFIVGLFSRKSIENVRKEQ